MVVVLALAGLAVLGAVVVLAMGGGGELAGAQPDHPPLPLPEDRPLIGAEAAVLPRPPRTVWGYHPDITDAALYHLACALSEREAQVADLERRLDGLRRRLGEAGRPGGAGGGAVNGDGGATFEEELFAAPFEVPPEHPFAEHESETDTEPKRRRARPAGLVKNHTTTEEPAENPWRAPGEEYP